MPFALRSSKRKAVTERGELNVSILVGHFCGGDGDLIGLHAISRANTCKYIAIDLDNHGAGDSANAARNFQAVMSWVETLGQYNIESLLTESDGRGGYHLIVLFREPITSELAHQLAQWLTRDWRRLGLASPPEIFPKQPMLVAKHPLGNWLRSFGRHHTHDFATTVRNGKLWSVGNAAIDAITSCKPNDPARIPIEARKFTPPEKAVQTPNEIYRPYSKSGVEKTPLERVLARLRNVRPCGDQWSSRCPAHADSNNSLSIGESSDRRVLIHCHRGCAVETIIEEIEMSLTDLFPREKKRTAKRSLNPVRTYTRKT